MSPIERSTPIDPPSRTHAFITRCEFGGLAPGQLPWVLVEWCGGYQTGPDRWEYADPTATRLEGTDAVAFITANYEAYTATKAALYQLLLDKHLEKGAIT